MTVTELQIGDYVALKANPTNPYKIAGLNFNDNKKYETIYIQSLETGVVFETPIEKLVGIKLTKAILKKNSWKNNFYSTLIIDEKKDLQYYWQEHRLRCIWHGIDEYNNHAKVSEITFQCNIRYVHELQHALKLCGLSNLTINLKV